MPTSRSNRPKILVTIGDPAGVGPEVVVKALASPRIRRLADFFVIGDRAVLERAAGSPVERAIHLIDLANVNMRRMRPGKLDASCGRASIEYIDRALAILKSNSADGLVTAPVNKAAVRKAGFPGFEGHTEYLAAKTRTADYAMIFIGKTMKVALVTRHIALKSVPASLSADKIYRTIILAHRCLKEYFGILRPRIGVAGLNPHAGEGSLFGSEEANIIRPAVKKAASAVGGISGPVPPDVIFYDLLAGRIDCVVAMYHDQALIPFKMIHFKDGVNMTLGLPFIRTSPDHGTAFDIAGRSKADATSMSEALALAAGIAARQALKRC